MSGDKRLRRNGEALWIWAALVAAPALMFANLSLTYNFTPLFCRLGGALALHLLCASFALPTVIMTAGSVKAWQQREESSGGEDASSSDATFLAEAASIVAASATLVVLAQWLAIWILPPCF